MKDVERVVEIGRVELIERKEVLGNGESDIEMTDCGVWEEQRMNTKADRLREGEKLEDCLCRGV